jgi:hypothetical protein
MIVVPLANVEFFVIGVTISKGFKDQDTHISSHMLDQVSKHHVETSKAQRRVSPCEGVMATIGAMEEYITNLAPWCYYVL